MSKSKIIALAAVITALALMPVLQACSHKKIVAVGAVDYDVPKDGGSLVGVVKLKPKSSYVGARELLAKYVKEEDETAWREIKEKIDYSYGVLGHALWPVLRKDNLKDKIVAEINAGRKLFFKVNITDATTFGFAGDGTTGPGYPEVEWPFVAALMRFFHDELGICYYQMAIGEAPGGMPATSVSLKCTMEAVMEGTPHGVEADYWVGWAFYFVRKYLAETTTPHDPKDDPQSGYLDSVEGNYVTPGQATVQGKLMVYDLNNAEWFDRGRRVYVPDGGDNFKEGIIIHKAIVGDPNDPDNYPGCVLVNTAMLKVHVTMILTGATKNIGMGLWPSRSGHDNDPNTPDWLYSYPADSSLGIKGVHFPKWYVSEFDDEAMPLKITDKPSMGLNGTIVDMNLAIMGQVPYVLHAINAVNIIDVDHYSVLGVPREEGLIFASTDPVALDLLGARYMFKNLPGDFNSPSRFARTLPLPRYDKTSGAIVTDQGVEDRVSRATLFDYAAKRGLGSLKYYVEGRDETTAVPSPLVSKDGHFGRLDDGKFVEIITDELFYSRGNNLYDLQPAVLAHAQATDTLSGSNYYKQFMALDEDGNGIIDDSERGKKGFEDCSHRIVGILFSLLGKGEPEHGGFFINSRLMKYADPAWNVGAVDSTKILWDAQAFASAWSMATDKENEGIDPFFGVPYGAVDGKSKWPSLQYARYKLDISTIHGGMYATAAAYSKRTGKPFKLYVPRKVPYAPPSSPGKQPWSYNPDKAPHIVELDPTNPNYSKLVFTAEFSDEVW